MLYLQDFNLCLLASCLSVGVQRVCKDHGAVLFDTAQQVAFDRLAGVIELLPTPHQPLLSSAKTCTDYWQKLNQVYGESQSELSLFFCFVFFLQINACSHTQNILVWLNQGFSELFFSAETLKRKIFT